LGCIFFYGGRIVPRRYSDLVRDITPNSLKIYHTGFPIAWSTFWHFFSLDQRPYPWKPDFHGSYSQKGCILLERVAHTAWVLWYLLYSAWGTPESSYIHLSIVFWRHYQSHTSFFYMYAISALLWYEVRYIYSIKSYLSLWPFHCVSLLFLLWLFVIPII